MRPLNLLWTIRTKRHNGIRIGGGSLERAGSDDPQDGMTQARTGVDALKEGISLDQHSDLGPVADNSDVWKIRFRRRRGMTRIRRLLIRARRFMRAFASFAADFVSPKFSPDEKVRMAFTLHKWDADALEEHRRARAEKRLYIFHREQARILEKQIVNVLTNLGHADIHMKDNRRVVRRRIKIAHTAVTPYSYTYHVIETPYGVSKTKIATPETVTEISSTIAKKIRYELDENGLRIVVEVGSTLSIPNFVSFAEFDKMPRNQPPLSFYVGNTTNGAAVFRNLAEAPHMIVAGQTGGGKSNLINSIICGLISRQPPNVVKLVLLDLKGGVEFDIFYGVPHLWKFEGDTDGIIEMPEGIMPALEAIKAECDRRMKILKHEKKKNISEYNRGRHERNRIPYIMVVFDEYATARKLVTEEFVDKKGNITYRPAGERLEAMLASIANISRAAGIHFILGTQYPKADILSTLISINFPWRVAFNMSNAASISVMGNWNANGLNPVGRAILQTSTGELMLQTPRITERTIENIVHAVKNNEIEIRVNTVDAEEILAWALDNMGGVLQYESIFNHFNERISKHKLSDLLRSITGETLEVEGNLYRVEQPPNPSQPRRMRLVEGEAASDEQRETIPQ